MNREVEGQEVLNRVPLEVESPKQISQEEEAEALKTKPLLSDGPIGVSESRLKAEPGASVVVLIIPLFLLEGILVQNLVETLLVT